MIGKFTHRTALFSLLLLTVIILTSGCSTLRNAKPWHRIELQQEFSADMVSRSRATPYLWSDYLQQEDKLFAELQEELRNADTHGSYRYEANSLFNPLMHSTNWNRSFVIKPENIRAGIVMLHGLTDSPYSVRQLAHRFAQQGFMVIAVRLPGHGTLPSGLLNVSWHDWVAATRLATEEMQRHLGDKAPFYLLGYSNGGALALNYSLDALDDARLRAPTKIILLSPMIGISRFAGLSESLDLIGHLPLLSSQRWLSKNPEYNPFKYNSFPVNGAWQAHRFSRQLRHKIQRLAAQQKLQQLPPVLTFQSAMDATVKTAAIEQHFYRYLPANHSELVLFDINRHQNYAPITRPKAANFIATTFARTPRNYDLVTITNSDTTTMNVSEWRSPAGSQGQPQEHPLNLAFPPGVFSLSHVALPFPMDDPVYGLTPRTDEFYGIRLGSLHLLGESNTIILSASTGMRLYANPFYSYMEERMLSWLDMPQEIPQ